MKTIKLTLLLSLLLFSSCKKQKPKEFTFKIKKSNHQSSLSSKLLLSKTAYSIEADFLFTESCEYDIGTDQSDWNKLIGFNHGTFSHHKNNSSRVGWRWDLTNSNYELGYYVKKDGERITGVLDKVKSNEWFHVKVYKGLHNKVNIKVNNHRYQYKKSTDEDLTNYILWPYFGGNEEAPHDMTVKCRNLMINGKSN